MFAISRRHAHFVFAVIQAGLTSLIAAGIASLPVMTISQFFSTLAIILDCVLDNDIASRFAGCPADSIALAFADERRLRRRRSRAMSTLPLKATAEAEFPHSVKSHYQRRQQQLLWRWKRCPRAVNVNSHQPAAGDANRDAFRDA